VRRSWRTVYLKYPLTTHALQTPAQVQHCTELYGHAGAAPAAHNPSMHHHGKERENRCQAHGSSVCTENIIRDDFAFAICS
jgi:hypothetical protein